MNDFYGSTAEDTVTGYANVHQQELKINLNKPLTIIGK
jgi:hypothetical protein